MMFEIINKQVLANDVKRLDVLAPHIARRIHTGQFVSVCPVEDDERIPLAVIDSDAIKGTITLIFQEVGYTTRKLGALQIKEPIFSILGPLGVPANIEKKGVVVCVATGVGAAQILPVCRAFKDVGNKVIGVIGAKTKKALILESQIRLSCNKIFITTNDGSYERRGQATEVLREIIERREVQLVYTIGSVDMMEAICAMTKEKKIPTLVRLNPVMVDCMGMCGSCRVKVGEKTVLACIDGPEFDGHQVDFNDFNIRMKAFEELQGWHNHRFQPSQKISESRILTRFLSGILKK